MLTGNAGARKRGWKRQPGCPPNGRTMGSLPVDFAEIKPEDYRTAIHRQPAFIFGERCLLDTLCRSSVAPPVWDQRPRRSSARPPESPGARAICTSHLRRFLSKRAWNPPSLIRQLGFVHRRTSVCYATRRPCRGVAQSGLARLLWEQEVAGSNPAAPTIHFPQSLQALSRFSPCLSRLSMVP